MKYDLFELSVAVPSRHGTSKIPEYGHKGLTFVEGRPGQPYTLKLRNDSAQRVLAVVSVDGLNVVDGQPCTPQGRGYIIPAYSAVDIDGWRTSLSEVHRFKFEGKDQSYSKSATGETQNCGIISAKFFSEKPDPLQPYKEVHHHHHHYEDHWYPVPYPVYPRPTPIWPTWREIWYTSSAGPTGAVGASGPVGTTGSLSDMTIKCASNTASGEYTVSNSMGSGGSTLAANFMAATSDVPEFKLGTGWGEAKADSVSETKFEREKELCTLAIYYADAPALERVGIQLTKDVAVTTPAAPELPRGFPGFCKPPVSR